MARLLISSLLTFSASFFVAPGQAARAQDCDLYSREWYGAQAYGAGDEVSATIRVLGPTGEPLWRRALKSTVWLDGETSSPDPVRTDDEGGAIVRFKLPARIERGDGVLTVLVSDGGVTESITKRIRRIVTSKG